MSITKTKISSIDGNEVFLFILNNENGLVAEIFNYGGIIKSLVYKGIDVVLGRDNLEDYLDNDGYFGALIGRNSNRIENSEFELSGKVYKLFNNDGRNNLHGGKSGFDKKVWSATTVDSDEPSLILELTSPDGEEGFPGNADIKVTYTLTKENSLKIHYEALCDKDTVMNLTNHSYFNLNGHSAGTIDNHTLWLNSDFYTPNTSECIPFGEVLSVKDTPFDFTIPKMLKESFNSDCEQIRMFEGIDHNFSLNENGYRLVAKLKGDISNIEMEIYTDRPAVQIYTGNVIDAKRVCKGKNIYTKHGAICLETQTFPNGLKYSHYPNGILKCNEKFDSTTEYKFEG